MKIIILGPAHPYRGGIADTDESFAAALSKQGHDTQIFTFSLQYPNFLFPGKTQYSGEKAPENIRITRIINSLNPLNWIKTARKINNEKPELIIIRYWLPFLAPCMGTIARIVNKKTKIIALTDNVLPHEKRPGDTLLTKYFINSCNAFIAMSKTVENEMNIFTNKPKIYIPHPINDNLGQKIDKNEARKLLKLEADTKYVLFFGLIRKYKGLDILLNAMAQPRVKQKNIKLIIAGEFYENPKEYTDLIQKLNIEDSVIIDSRFIPLAEIKNYFSAADLSAQTYRTASQSGISQIALNFELPMLVTDVGGLSEIVKNKYTGFVTSKNPEDIAQTISDIFENTDIENIINNIKEEKIKFSWDNFAHKVCTELYNKL